MNHLLEGGGRMRWSFSLARITTSSRYVFLE